MVPPRSQEVFEFHAAKHKNKVVTEIISKEPTYLKKFKYEADEPLAIYVEYFNLNG